jgi:hypothetical protein
VKPHFIGYKTGRQQENGRGTLKVKGKSKKEKVRKEINPFG